jgi:hypothetical protein
MAPGNKTTALALRGDGGFYRSSFLRAPTNSLNRWPAALSMRVSPLAPLIYSTMKTFLPSLLTGLLLVSSLAAQSYTPVPEPEKPQADLPVRIDASAPLDSLEEQLKNASFDQRGELAAAFDTVNRSLEARVAELRNYGAELDDAASENLSEARDFGRQTFRDMSLTTEETWQTARHNALMALRKIRNSLQTLQRTAVVVQS